ncbi:MAG: helix-turn-helix transcriptional regulator [Lachnospiraceae bacterium]|nr:helix-turn-helix transcriptional regulator [Lachnospiraceae bacterium]
MVSTALMFPIFPPFNSAYRFSSTDWPVGPHCHDGGELYLTLSDLPDVLIDDKVIEVPSGTLIIIPPFCVHQLYHEADRVYERYVLGINTTWLNRVFCGDGEVFPYLNPHHPPTFFKPDAETLSSLRQKLDALSAFERFTSPEAVSSLLSLLGDLRNTAEIKNVSANPIINVSDSQKRVNDIIFYINEHIEENISVRDLASRFFLNPDYMSRMFKAHAHIPVSRFILLQKISAAQDLLRQGRTVNEVQEQLHFSSYAYFFKTFRKLTGISPSRYRAQYMQS